MINRENVVFKPNLISSTISGAPIETASVTESVTGAGRTPASNDLTLRSESVRILWLSFWLTLGRRLA